MFSGSYVAIVTPFNKGAIDKERLKDLIEFHIAEGTSGIVPCGTTGESATMTGREHQDLIDMVIEIADKRIPVIAGTGSNSTEEAIFLTKHAASAGAYAALLITPYYNKPEQEGLYQHYKAITDQVDLPVILYNVPGRTAVNMLPATVKRLSSIKNIAAIKEASGSLAQVSEIISLCGDDIAVLSGDDANTLPIMAVGGKGVISVTANIVPGDIASMCKKMEHGQIAEARALHNKLLPLHNALFVETNPIPVKAALYLLGKISDELRLPLTKISKANKERLIGAMRSYGIKVPGR